MPEETKTQKAPSETGFAAKPKAKPAETVTLAEVKEAFAKNGFTKKRTVYRKGELAALFSDGILTIGKVKDGKAGKWSWAPGTKTKPNPQVITDPAEIRKAIA